MKWHYDPSEQTGIPGAILCMEIEAQDVRTSRPLWRIEIASPAYLRMQAGERPILWARRVDRGFWILTADEAKLEQTSALPPLRASDVRSIKHEPGSPDWYRAWSRRFGQMLLNSPCSPLHPGVWELKPCEAVDSTGRSAAPVEATAEQAAPRVYGLHKTLNCPPLMLQGWFDSEFVCPLRTRKPSSEPEDRVKVWRKHVRDGSLPPILLWFVSPLDQWVVLDGHDRLLAASLEGVMPPLISIGAIRCEDPLIRCSIARAWPLPGGVKEWQKDVAARLHRLEQDEHPMVRT